MSSRLVPSVLVVLGCLSSLAGCSAASNVAAGSSSPANVAQETARDDASWASPEEKELTFVEKPQAAPPKKPRIRRPSPAEVPNHEQRPVRGAVHAATY